MKVGGCEIEMDRKRFWQRTEGEGEVVEPVERERPS